MDAYEKRCIERAISEAELFRHDDAAHSINHLSDAVRDLLNVVVRQQEQIDELRLKD